MLLVVDDLQWADAPSLGFLAYLVRRLEGLPVAVAAAARPALPGETREEIEAIVAEAGGTALTPGPLSSQAVTTLTETKLGAAPASEFVDAGFVNVRTEKFMIPYGVWPKDHHLVSFPFFDPKQKSNIVQY